MSHNLHHSLQEFKLAHGTGKYYSLRALEAAGIGKISRLPVSIRIVLESVLRNCDGKKVTEEHVRQVANWSPNGERTDEIPFVVARVVLQDFTGVPLLADLAAMRNVARDMGKDPKTSVLNAHNQAHDAKNLFITDGACMTSSSCVNPSLTYMALTARACDYAVNQMKRGEI